MNRRDLIKSAVLGAGAAVAGTAQTQQAQHHAEPAPLTTVTNAWKPLLFDAHQNETVVVLSELIIPATDTPGAKAAKVNEFIDLFLHDMDPEQGKRVVEGLGWLDGYSLRNHGLPFVKCSEAQQVEILKTLDGSKEADLKTGADLFSTIKRLTMTGYYTSKIGIDELNKGGRVPETFGCRDGEHG